MQPPLFKRARSLHRLLAELLLLGIVAAGTGCTNQALPTETYSPFGTIDTLTNSSAPRDSVLALLTTMNRTAFDSAFARLDGYAVTRYVRTERLDTTGTTTAHRTLTVHYRPGTEEGTVRRADSAGSFGRGGPFSSITPNQQFTTRPANITSRVLSDQPAYVAPRTQEAYRYALRRDTLPGGMPTYVLEAKARVDKDGGEQPIRYARLTLHRPSKALIGLTTTRASRVLLFSENSLVTIRLRRASDGTWVPHFTRFRSVVKVPFRAPRQFRTVSAYYAYARQ